MCWQVACDKLCDVDLSEASAAAAEPVVDPPRPRSAMPSASAGWDFLHAGFLNKRCHGLRPRLVRRYVEISPNGLNYRGTSANQYRWRRLIFGSASEVAVRDIQLASVSDKDATELCVCTHKRVIFFKCDDSLQSGMWVQTMKRAWFATDGQSRV